MDYASGLAAALGWIRLLIRLPFLLSRSAPEVARDSVCDHVPPRAFDSTVTPAMCGVST